MSHVAGYSTLEEFLDQQRYLRSPILQRSAPNRSNLDTPPPFVDAPEGYEPCSPGGSLQLDHPEVRKRAQDRPKPSLYDTLLVSNLGPSYPAEIAERAGVELFVNDPDSPYTDRIIRDADEIPSMIALNSQRHVSEMTSPQFSTEPALTASRRASEKLHDALGAGQGSLAAYSISNGYHRNSMSAGGYSVHEINNKRKVSVSVTSIDDETYPDALQVSHLTLRPSPPPNATSDLLQSSRPKLPSLRIGDHDQTHRRHGSLSDPQPGVFLGSMSQTLPRLQNQGSPSSASTISQDHKQTLPSLEMALSAVTDSNGTPYPDTSPSFTRPSPSHNHYGHSPAMYSNDNTPVALSPPRLSANSAAWRSLSHNSSNSTASENVSGHSSQTSSTPATRASPSHSVSTPGQYPVSEHESIPDSENVLQHHSGSYAPLAPQGYSCAFPGCTAPPFQTQYLLNSHANVHSNQRPHFCPVEGCPRGPGGQGFKRKNEMIRHGLVHQSPGYVCPFCPDQQHRYPRPDNLQRHVRVHHIERDRDDPMLRDVLAQRPEGGNRGRRRRLGG